MLATELLPTAQDVAFFKENGFWIAPKIIDDERLEALREHMALIYAEQYETGRTPWRGYWKPGSSRLRKTDNTHWSDLTFRALVTDPAIGAIAARLMQADIIRLWHDQLLYKPGLEAGETAETANVGWHQDYHYWECAAQPSLLTAWVAFDDVDTSNGCMQVVKGSNQWGLVNANNFFEQDLKKQESAMEIPGQSTFEVVPLIMKAGQVSFHHAMTLHGSGPNNTLKPRRSIAIHLMTGDTRYRAGTPSDSHMNLQLYRPEDGALFEGEMFPVLYNRLNQ
jgi:ectoine hydroxylase-related dioxygenase (phytanoyl-CoA dioxygenase family)